MTMKSKLVSTLMWLTAFSLLIAFIFMIYDLYESKSSAIRRKLATDSFFNSKFVFGGIQNNIIRKLVADHSGTSGKLSEVSITSQGKHPTTANAYVLR